jgi:hypothetical protein
MELKEVLSGEGTWVAVQGEMELLVDTQDVLLGLEVGELSLLLQGEVEMELLVRDIQGAQ